MENARAGSNTHKIGFAKPKVKRRRIRFKAAYLVFWSRPSMQSVSNDNFGPLVAYLVPGATVLVGASQFVPTVRSWLAATPADAPTIGGFLYLTIASLAVGMTVSAVRWALIDTLHNWTGLAMPALDFSRLGVNVEAFSLLIRIHYEFYQHFANMFVATAVAYVCYRVRRGGLLPLGWVDLGFVLLEVVFFAASRDTLRKYLTRGRQLLGESKDGRHESGLADGRLTCNSYSPGKLSL